MQSALLLEVGLCSKICEPVPRYIFQISKWAGADTYGTFGLFNCIANCTAIFAQITKVTKQFYILRGTKSHFAAKIEKKSIFLLVFKNSHSKQPLFCDFLLTQIYWNWAAVLFNVSAQCINEPALSISRKNRQKEPAHTAHGSWTVSLLLSSKSPNQN